MYSKKELIKKYYFINRNINDYKTFKYKTKSIFLKNFFISLIILIAYLSIKKKNDINKENEKNGNKLKICLCSIAKNENLYIKEFIEHYKELGYTNIFLYDNNEINGERFEDVIKNEIDKKFVYILNFRGMRSQLTAYTKCYDQYKNKCDWISFFDVDEFLELKPSNLKVQDFFGNKRFDKCDNIKINWVYYDHNAYYYENITLFKRTNYTIRNNIIIKSTIRGKYKTNYWRNAGNPHSSNKRFRACTSSGKKTSYKDFYVNPPDIEYAILRHYKYKSFEEACIKLKRGRADLDANIKKNMILYYEEYKNDTIKLDIMKKIFNLTEIK